MAGHGSLVLIGGEAGIGKTALAETICREAEERDTLVLIGRCYDLTETPPYGPWVELFGSYAPTNALPPLPPAFAERGTVGAVASQDALYRQVRDFLTDLSAQQPLLLLDDLHWADPASLDLLRAIARIAPTLSLLILGIYRADEITRRHPLYALLPALVREAHAERVDLRHLTDDDLHVLIDARYGLRRADATRLTAYLAERAEGNPFFVGELLRTLEEERVLHRMEDDWALGDPHLVRVPALLRQVIDGRLARLGEEAQRVLAVAAVIGQDVPFALWARASGIDEEALLPVIERAVEARVLAETPDGTQVRFVHALIREALYEGMLATRRRTQHRRIGDVLAAMPGADPDAVAYHFRQAGDPRAIDWLIRAGERAEDAFAYETATARFQELIPLLGDDPARVVIRAETHLRLARLWRLDATRCLGYAREALRLATESGDTSLVEVARHRLAINTAYDDNFGAAIAAMEPVSLEPDTLPASTIERFLRLDRLSATGWYRRASYALRLSQVGRLVEAERYAIAARTEGEARGDIPANVSSTLAVVYPALGRVAEARAMYAAIRAYFLSIQEFVGVATMCMGEISWVIIPYLTDEPHLRDALVRTADTALSRSTEQISGLLRASMLHGLYYLEGRWDEMPPIPSEILRRSRGRRWPVIAYESARAHVAVARGEVDVAWAIMSGLIPDGLATEPGTTWFKGTVSGQWLAASLALASGDLATARAWLDMHDHWLAWSGMIPGRSESQALWAQYHRQAGDMEDAYAHAQRALALATEPRQPLALLQAHRLLGELEAETGRFTNASEHLDVSLTLADACAAPYERSLTLLAMAELRAATGEEAEAARLLDEARTLLTRLGAKPALARAEALAARLRTARSALPTYPAGLSVREVEVLRLVAAGLTNPEIAERLFVGIRTVETHMRAIYNKLGTSSRTVATRFAIEHNLA